MATDLRLITSAMKINSDLERIGDQAVNIAENVVKILPHPPLKPLIDIPRMAEIAEKMTRDGLDSFVRRDAEPGPRRACAATTRWTSSRTRSSACC